jgi:hypothetical protein
MMQIMGDRFESGRELCTIISSRREGAAGVADPRRARKLGEAQ